ncbi:hypothetical protein ABZP36_025487 [Zizania latifolia]
MRTLVRRLCTLPPNSVVVSSRDLLVLFVDWCGVLDRGRRLVWTAVLTTFFEVPNSLNKVPCPSIYDPAEKYNSLIIPAYNEEHRLPEALTETLNYLQQHSYAEKPFTYEKFYGVAENPSEEIVNKLKPFVEKKGLPKNLVVGSCTVLETAGQGALGRLYKVSESAIAERENASSAHGQVIRRKSSGAEESQRGANMKFKSEHYWR